MNEMYKVIKANRNFRVISIANFINRLGDSAETIAYTYLLYLFTGSATISALGLCVNLLPSVIIQPIVGPFVEKHNHKYMMIAADSLRGVMVLVLVGIYILGELTYGDLLLINFLISTVECFRVPAGAAIIPSICREDEYETQASMNSIISTLATIIGAIVAGIVLEKLSVAAIFIWDSVTFLVSGMIICFLKIPAKLNQAENVEKESYFVSLTNGMRLFFSNRELKLLVVLVIANNLLAAPFSALEAPIVNGLLEGEANLLSVISVAGTIGIITGSIIFTKVSKALGRKKIIVIALASNFFFYLAIIGIANIKIYGLKVVSMFAINFLSSFVSIWLSLLINSSFIEQVPKDMIGRGAAVFNAISAAIMPVLSFLTAMAVIYIPVRGILMIASILAAACTLAITVFLKNRGE